MRDKTIIDTLRQMYLFYWYDPSYKTRLVTRVVLILLIGRLVIFKDILSVYPVGILYLLIIISDQIKKSILHFDEMNRRILETNYQLNKIVSLIKKNTN